MVGNYSLLMFHSSLFFDRGQSDQRSSALFTFHFSLFTLHSYLTFRVIIANAAKIMDAIQKRMVIFDSWNGRCGHPLRM